MSIIAIEGIDGSGKTTQANLLKKKLEDEGYEVEYIRTIFMLSTMISKKVGSKKKNLMPSPRKKIIKEESEVGRSDITNVFKGFFFTVFAYFYGVISYLIIFHRSKNRIIICDRFFFHFFYDVYKDHAFFIMKLFPKPDLVYFLDADIDVICSRMDQEIDKNTKKSYFLKVQKFYREICEDYEFIWINANSDVEKINNIIYFHLNENKVLNKVD